MYKNSLRSKLDGKVYFLPSFKVYPIIENERSQMFEVGNKQEALRAAKIAKEYGKKYILVGTGDEYQRLDEIKATASPIVVTLNYPQPFDVEDPLDAQQIALSDLKHWELAPTNAARLADAGVEIAISSLHLGKKEDFLANIRKAIENGLSEENALKALTHTPAKLLKASENKIQTDL